MVDLLSYINDCEFTSTTTIIFSIFLIMNLNCIQSVGLPEKPTTNRDVLHMTGYDGNFNSETLLYCYIKPADTHTRT